MTPFLPLPHELSALVAKKEARMWNHRTCEPGKYRFSNGVEVTVIDMQTITTQCCMCGVENADKCGIPVDSETAEIVSNDFEGEWGCVPACRKCHDLHAAGAFVGDYPKF